MAGFAESIMLKAPPEEAFAYLGDPSTATTVDPAVISYEPDSNSDEGRHGQPGQGTSWGDSCEYDNKGEGLGGGPGAW